MGRAVALPPFGTAKRGDPPEGGESRRLQGRISAVKATAPCAASPFDVVPSVIATAANPIPTNVDTYVSGIYDPEPHSGDSIIGANPHEHNPSFE